MNTYESLEKFNAELYDEFAEGRDTKEAEKAERLAPYIEAALARRQTRPPLTDSQIDIVPASRPKTWRRDKTQINRINRWNIKSLQRIN